MKEIMEYLEARYLAPHMGEKGQGIVEYALILAFVAVVAAAITGEGDLKTKVQGVFTTVSGLFGTTKDTTGGN